MANDLETGALLLEKIAARPKQRYAGAIRTAIDALRDAFRSVPERIGPAMSGELWPVLTADPIRELVTASDPVKIWVDRPLAEFGSWYEFFPRSSGAEIDSAGLPIRHGTFKDSIFQLDRAKSMSFDVLYLPPIHPIGTSFRKGRNNTLDAAFDDVGSPWAIGNSNGGHTAIHGDWAPSTTFVPWWPRRQNMASRSQWTTPCSAVRITRG